MTLESLSSVPEGIVIDGATTAPLRVAEYVAFVGRTDLSDGWARRFDVALYGLVGEIGSVAAAVKKRLLVEGRSDWNIPNDEIIEELGDSLWYCFALAAAEGIETSFLASDIKALIIELGGDTPRSARLHEVLGDRARQFLQLAPELVFFLNDGTATLEDYRRVAFLTLRTTKDEAVEVCLAVLQQLAAELFRQKLPELERELNRALPDRPLALVLGETAWHLAALASLYGLNLDQVARRNETKLLRRFGRGDPTPLLDELSPKIEQLPRHFKVEIVSVGPGRSRMYLDGSRLGDDLTDNAYLEDGYRFHDVMHLAFAAKLGWSPVLRKLLGRKRRGDARIDEVEDGARAGIVEEAVINAIHAEGVRLAALMARRGVAGPRLFPNRADMSFAFLKRVEALVAGLEVQHHRYWEWEDAILEGFRIFEQLRASGRGTIALDLNTRSISFDSKVFADVAGSVVALGTASVPLTELVLATDDSNCVSLDEHAEVRRLAVLDALGLENVPTDELMIGGWRRDIVDVITDGSVKSAIWDKGIVTFRISVAQAAGCIIATCLAIGDKP
jgi:NTP pyrophosphatase (non-canonical NTP hydrolase)